MINVLYTIDNGFVPQLATNIYSVCSNADRADRLAFHIFSDGISDENISALHAFVQQLGHKITFYDISDFEKTIGFDFDTKGWKKIVLARLLMARYLPNSIERVLYLDGDTIVRDSLHDLWNTDLKGKTVGMVVEPTVSRKRLSALHIENFAYHNAGVLLVDLSKWRDSKTEEKLLRYCKKHRNLFANDQDALNVVLSDSIFGLDPKFNYSNIFDYYPYWFLKRREPSMVSNNIFKESQANPAIVHFLGEERPWRIGNTHRFSNEYLAYLSKTPWSDSPLENGWELYFKIWKIFNFIMKPVPHIRLLLINSLIPVFMSARQTRLKQ